MPKRITVTECPNCGAPVEAGAVGDADNPSCPFCHAILPVAPDAPPVAPQLAPFGGMPAPMTTRVPMPVPRRGAGRALGVTILVVTLAIVGVAVAIPLLLVAHARSAAAGSYRLEGPIALATGPGSPHAEYVLAPQAAESGSVVLRRVDAATHQTVWSSAAIALPDAEQPTVLAAGSGAVVIAGTSVIAFDGATGRQRWQSSISNALATRADFEGVPAGVADCLTGCAVVIGTTLVTLAKDGTVQGTDTATGRQLWSRRLADTPDWLEAAGGKAAIVSSPVSGRDALLLFTPATGAERTISPACAGTGDGEAAAPSEDGGFYVSPDGSTLTALVTGTGGCVASYRLSDGRLRWRSKPDTDDAAIPFTLTGETVTAGDGYVAWTNEVGHDRWVFVAGTAGGHIRKLWNSGDEGATASLDGATGGTLVAEVAPSFDSERPDVYGISLASGKQLWKLASRVLSDSGSQTQAVVVTSTGIAVASCASAADDSSGTCRFEAVDPVLGTVKAGAPSVTTDDPIPGVDLWAAPRGDVLAEVNSSVAVIFDPRTGRETGRWPS